MVALKICDLESRADLTPWLASLYVDKKHRNQGIGTQLVHAIEQEAVKLGVKKLFLFTPGTESFYARLGWVVKERTELHGHPATIMEKTF